ncbi:MAG: M15 family metallopeptidase [Prosthecobacter sp.]
MPPVSRYFLILSILLSSCETPRERRSVLVPGRSVELAANYDLVDVRAFIPGVSIDLRYATPRNVTNRAIYPARMPCLLRIETAQKLKAAQDILSAQGYGLRVWDAYRPPEVQEELHRHGGDTGMFVSPQTGWSRHCGGIAVDLTLVDARGTEQRMPTYFDEDFANASRHYRGGDPVVRQNLQILNEAMRQAGFTQLESEWWHFDDADYVSNPQPVVFGHQLAIPTL